MTSGTGGNNGAVSRGGGGSAVYAIHKILHTITECHIMTYYCIISQNFDFFRIILTFWIFSANHKVPKRRVENSQPILNDSLENKIRAKCLYFWNGFNLVLDLVVWSLEQVGGGVHGTKFFSWRAVFFRRRRKYDPISISMFSLGNNTAFFNNAPGSTRVSACQIFLF